MESPVTFTGKPKPLFFTSNQHLFRKWLPKIRCIVFEPHSPTSAWDAESQQRNAVELGLQDANADDVLIISDADEIPRATCVSQFATKNEELAALEVSLYYYKLNGQCLRGPDSRATAPLMVRRRSFTSGQHARELGRRHWKYQTPIMHDGGWHFSWQQDPEAISRKLQSFAHTEYSTPAFTDVVRIKHRIKFGLDIVDRTEMVIAAVPIDHSFPAYLREHQDEFADMLYDLPQFNADRQAAIRQIDQLTAQITSFETSRSWRITAHLRSISSWVRARSTRHR